MAESDANKQEEATEKDARGVDARLLRRIVSFLMPYKGWVAVAFVSVMVAAFLGPLRPKLIQIAIDDHIVNGDLDGLWRIVLWLFGALVLEGVLTHLPVADEPDNPFTADQLRRFDALVADLRAAGLDPPFVHAANSAGGIAHPAARYDMVRFGIAVYGIPPAPALDGRVGLLLGELLLLDQLGDLALGDLARDDAILCADLGTVATWAARHFDVRGDREF